MNPLTARGTELCRGCGSAALTEVLDLGEQPLSNELGRTPDEELPCFPLALSICSACALGQVGEYVMPERIFAQNYPYLSSTSIEWLAHARGFAVDMVQKLDLGADQRVIEVASNDGYLLSAFQSMEVSVLGVEPAHNVASIARAAGIPTIAEFFGRSLAERLVKQVGRPRLVVANNVMAHVPDLDDFIGGLDVLCAEDTLITIENPSLLTLLQEAQFDTIYHEHFSYLSAHSVSRMVRKHGLELVHVDELSTHGGSNRYHLRRSGVAPIQDSVKTMLIIESQRGLLDPTLWETFARRSREAIDALADWMSDRMQEGSVVAGYGAAAKGNTFLNAVGQVARSLAFVVDNSVEKQGKYLPGTKVPILAPKTLVERAVDHVLVLPWNISDELVALVRDLTPGTPVWVAMPRMEQLA